MAVDRRLLINLDAPLLFAVVLLSAIGSATIWSATKATAHADLYLKQLTAIALGVAGLVVVISLDYRRLADRATFFYVLSVMALGYVLMFGPRIAGTRRWLVLGGTQFQPSEFVKLAAALFVAKVLADSRKDDLGLADVAPSGAAVGLLAVLIAAEPDLGTAFCLVPLFLTVALLAGLRVRAVATLAAVGLVVSALGWNFMLRDYQKSRIYTFLDPASDPRGAGYQTIQSQIAVGSGGLTGKGFGNGSQVQLGYLPARQTDFIFSVLAEEFGFVGVAIVLGLYLFVLWRMLDTAQRARDRIGAFLAAGIAATFGFQVVYNVGMVAGLVPVKGLPLPFLSYGGSSVLASLLGIGLVLNVRMRRFAN